MMFSVVTPTLNGGSRLRACVGSIRGQVGVPVEHIIQDGGSIDGSAVWAAAQPDLRVESGPDEGMYDALNRGFGRASGDIVSWLNSDEQYLPGALRAVADRFESDPEIDFVYGDAILVGPGGDPLAARREIPLRLPYLLNGPTYAISCTLFFRRRLVDRGLLAFDSTYKIVGDTDVVLRLLRSNCKAAKVDRYIGLFGITGHNLSTHSGFASEAERVRREHGAFRSEWLRRAVLAGRLAEKLLRGSYRSVALDYEFAVDEVPTWRRVRAPRVGWRWTFDASAFPDRPPERVPHRDAP
jgi:glycosyltransferase involved in cell wall biosynthesis